VNLVAAAQLHAPSVGDHAATKPPLVPQPAGKDAAQKQGSPDKVRGGQEEEEGVVAPSPAGNTRSKAPKVDPCGLEIGDSAGRKAKQIKGGQVKVGRSQPRLGNGRR